MKTLSIQVTYRRGKPWVAYIDVDRRPGEKSARTKELRPEIVVDFGADGRPIGIEVITPELVTVDELLGVFDELNLERPSPEEIAPCAAA